MATLVQLEANAKPECVQDLIDLLRQRLPETRAYDGCQEITAYLNDDGHTFVFVEQWDSKEHYDKYLAWRDETGVLAELVALLQEAPDIRFFEPVDV